MFLVVLSSLVTIQPKPPTTRRLIFYEAAKDQALREYKKNNKDVNACLRLGGAMIELSHYKSGAEAIQSMEEGMAKIEEALAIDPKHADAHYNLGIALFCERMATSTER